MNETPIIEVLTANIALINAIREKKGNDLATDTNTIHAIKEMTKMINEILKAKTPQEVDKYNKDAKTFIEESENRMINRAVELVEEIFRGNWTTVENNIGNYVDLNMMFTTSTSPKMDSALWSCFESHYKNQNPPKALFSINYLIDRMMSNAVDKPITATRIFKAAIAAEASEAKMKLSSVGKYGLPTIAKYLISFKSANVVDEDIRATIASAIWLATPDDQKQSVLLEIFQLKKSVDFI